MVKESAAGVGGIGHVLPEVELREQRVPGIVADVESGLSCVVAMGPGDVVNVLIALLQAALRAAEISAVCVASP